MTVLLGLSLIQPGKAQTNTKTGGTPFPDSPEAVAYRRLLHFISKDGPVFADKESENDLDVHYGEKHILVTPIARGVSREPTEKRQLG